MKFDKIRYTYLRSNGSHPHTCIATKVAVDVNDNNFATILYSVARRESPGATIFLKRRMQKIRELGGVVPESLHRQLKLLRKDFSKAKARFIARNRLDESFAYVAVEHVAVRELNAHTIMKAVMESIVRHGPSVKYLDVGGVEIPTTVLGIMECAREGAADWLNKQMSTKATTVMLYGGPANGKFSLKEECSNLR